MELASERIRDLENERQRVNEEIKNYPTPIPACDAQFNYLLEERARIAQELDRSSALSSEGDFVMKEAAGRRIIVFFYGLFMDEALLREKGINPENRRMALVENYSLVIGSRATLVPAQGQTVHGVIFSLTHNEVDALYAEASVSVYRPEAVSARLADGSVVPALCFNLPLPPTPLSTDQRDPHYVSKLRELAERIGLPPSYVSSIE